MYNEKRITTDPDIQQYEPKVFSRPSYANGDNEETADYQLGPWLAVLDNFLTKEECERLIVLGGEEGYDRSKDVGEEQADGSFSMIVNEERTSTPMTLEGRLFLT